MDGTKERILDATGDLLLERGYAGAGLKQIGSRAAAPLGSIYHHFPGGKEEMAELSIRRAGLAYQNLVMGVLRAGGEPVAAVRGAFVGAGEVLVATGYRDACPVATVALEVASSNERLRAATAEVFEGWVVAFTEYFSAWGVPATRGRALAMALIALLEGAFVLCRATRDTSAMDAAADAAVLLTEAAL